MVVKKEAKEVKPARIAPLPKADKPTTSKQALSQLKASDAASSETSYEYDDEAVRYHEHNVNVTIAPAGDVNQPHVDFQQVSSTTTLNDLMTMFLGINEVRVRNDCVRVIFKNEKMKHLAIKHYFEKHAQGPMRIYYENGDELDDDDVVTELKCDDAKCADAKCADAKCAAEVVIVA